ncbi:MAG: hypothetical protein Q9162_003993 [Coniocarpon cinnabarinum]
MSSNLETGNVPPSEGGNCDKTASLLNLLKFNQQPSRQNSQSAIPAVGQNGNTTLFDADSGGQRTLSPLPSQARQLDSSSPANNPQDVLLNLLRRSESSVSGQNKVAERSSVSDSRGIRDPMRQFGASVSPKDESPAPSRLPDGRSQLEALMGIGSGTGSRKMTERPTMEQSKSSAGESEAEAASAVKSAAIGDTADEVADALANLDPHSLKEAVHDAAEEIHDELKDGKTKSELENALSKPVVDALKETAEVVARDDVLNSWESAEADDGQDMGTQHIVKVFNLPMRPFVSLEIRGNESTPVHIRNDVVMKIATLKKEFDQVDRTLASASPNNIVYAMAKGGGFRVIRQEDGSNKTIFRGSDNLIFNVSISYSPRFKMNNELVETVLATSTDGTVYWTSIPCNQDESLEGVDLDRRGFVMPPLPSTDENTSTSQLKTRVRKSSRHPDFFAYGRGKSIYLIYPTVASSSTYIDFKTRVIDTQKYLSQRLLKIATGKAGKDFTFSEDDTVIASLDKHGRLKFWDITDHLALANETLPARPINMETKVPVMTMWLAPSSTKAWPTSVQFVDKDRPTAKGIASRYLLVGLKQNHTLQLWDLGLGKAVQEINLPHAHETDAICSIAYHAKSGIIIVGHPTRNSVYLIHLSAPKYTVPSMSQASYLHALDNKESRIPRPDSTAIMSGIREISLDLIGNMRSIDILSPASQSASDKDANEDETVFEVYLMHSRGVTCLNLKKQDFGWDKDGKVIDGRDAEAEGVVIIGELQAGTTAESGAVDGGKQTSKPPDKTEGYQDADTALSKSVEPSSTSKEIPAMSKADKKKAERKKNEESQAIAAKPPSYADALSRATGPSASPNSQPTSVSANGTAISTAPPATVAAPAVIRLEEGAGAPDSYISALTDRMNQLYDRMDEQRRISEVANDTRLETVLRLVSATLTENVEKTLHRIVSSSIEQQVIPSISNVATTTLEAKVPNAVSHQVAQSVPGALKASMPDAIAKSLQSPGVLQTIAEHVAAKLAPQVEKQLNNNLKSSIVPAFTKTAIDAARASTTEVERRVLDQLRQVEVQSKQDLAKLDQLTRSNVELVSTITDMASMQAGLHKELATIRIEIQQMRQEAAGANTVQRSDNMANSGEASIKIEEAENRELEEIARGVVEDRPAEATIRWLQSVNQEKIFEEVFTTVDPTALIPRLNSILQLSVAAAICNMLGQRCMEEKLAYLEAVLKVVDPQDDQIVEYAPRMMDVLKDRLGDEFMRVAEEKPAERALLTRVRTLVRNVEGFRSAVGRS